MRGKTLVAAAVLGLLTLAAGCSGADAVLDSQTTPGGGSPPSTVGSNPSNLGDDAAAGALGSR